MFAGIRTEFTRRSSETAAHWRVVDQLEQEELQSQHQHPALRTFKGLLFVAYYAIYEHVVTHAFACTIRQFNSYSIRVKDTRRMLLSLALHQHLQSVSDLNERKCWPIKASLFSQAEASDQAAIPDNLFPVDDSHFRHGQLETICSVIGLPNGALIPEPRMRGLISEIVEHRNAIAHGRETAANVGGRYSSADLNTKLSQLGDLCNHIITTLESHSADVANFQR